MKIIHSLVIAALFVAVNVTIADTVDVGTGILTIPDGYTQLRTGTKDSYRGELRRSLDDFKVQFDIGYMAGTRVSDKQKNYVRMWTMHINGHVVRLALEHREDGDYVHATMYEPIDWNQRCLRVRSEIEQLPPNTPKADSEPLLMQYKNVLNEKGIPANFSAKFSDHVDLVDFFLIVTGYIPSPIGEPAI